MFPPLRRLLTSRKSIAKKRKSQERQRLCLEQLEDRTLPSAVTLIVTTTGSTVDSTLPAPGQNRYFVDTLPTAVAFADANPGNTYTIKFAQGLSGAINLGTGSGTLFLNANMTIDGGTCGGITVEGGSSPNCANNVQVFFIEPGVDVAIKNLTIANGNQPTTATDPGGGGIFNAGMLALTNDIFLNNNANTGAAVYNAGEATAINSIFLDGTAYAGAGVFNVGVFSMKQDLFVGNQASAAGGGVYNTSTGTMTITGSVFLLNSAADGGGLENDGTMTLTNDAFIANQALFGGAIFEDGTLTLQNVFFFGNMASGAGNDIFVPGP